MEVKEFKTIKYMSDFADLFLAIYSVKKNISENNNKLYISKYFNDISKDIIMNYNMDIPELLDEDGIFKIDEFFEKITSSKVREYWNDNLGYDLKKDCVFTQIDMKILKEEIEKYDIISQDQMNSIVDLFISREEEKEQDKDKKIDQNNPKNRTYTLLNKKSDD